MATYRVRLTAGPYSWTVTDDDHPAYGLADPLVIGWSVPTDQTRPAQPDPTICQFSVITRAAADVALGLGDQVQCSVWFTGTGPLPPTTDPPDVWFRGRITDGAAEPSGTGVLYAFTCSDQTIDLTGADIGGADYAAQPWSARLAAYQTAAGPALIPPAAAAGTPPAFLSDPRVSNVDPNLWVDARDGSPDTVLDALIELFESAVFASTAGTTLFLPILAAGPGLVPPAAPTGYYPVAVDALPDRFLPSAAAPAPAVFGPVPGSSPTCYGVRVNPDDRAAGVLDACFVERDAGWTAIKSDVVNTAVITWNQAANVAADRVPQTVRVTEQQPLAGRVPVIQTRETQILALSDTPASVTAANVNADRLGHLLTPPFQEQSGWSADGFTWRLDQDTLGRDQFPVLFPLGYCQMTATGQLLRTVAYVRPIVVAQVPPAWNPMTPDTDRIYGQLSEVRMSIAAGRPIVEFTLTPTLPTTGTPSGSVNSWNATPGTWNAQTGVWDDRDPGFVAFRWDDPGLVGVTWNQLCRSDSWFDYQLLRGS